MKSIDDLLAEAEALEKTQERTTGALTEPTEPPSVSFGSEGEAHSQEISPVPADRQEWADKLASDLTRWLSVHPPELWRSARTWNRITPRLERLDVLVSDYLTSGEEGDRRAAVFAANAVAAEAGRIADERGNR